MQRAAAEIGPAGDPSPEKVARIRERPIGVADSSEHLIDSLLLLAVSEEGLESTGAVDLAALAGAEPEATAHEGPAVVTDLAPLTVRGDRALLDRLVRNLPANAVRHKRPGGQAAGRPGRGGRAAGRPGRGGHGAGAAGTGRGGLTVSDTGPARGRVPSAGAVPGPGRAPPHGGRGRGPRSADRRLDRPGPRRPPAGGGESGAEGGITVRVHFQPAAGPRDDRNGRSVPFHPV